MKAAERITTRVEELLQPALQRFELSLYDVEFHPGRKSAVLRVTIDRPGGVDVDQCARVSDVLSRYLDAEDLISGRYQLEVSSPGLTRKLSKPRHYRASLGCRVKVELKAPVGEVRSFEGVLQTVSDDEELSFESSQGPIRVPRSQVASCRLVLDDFGGKKTRRKA